MRVRCILPYLFPYFTYQRLPCSFDARILKLSYLFHTGGARFNNSLFLFSLNILEILDRLKRQVKSNPTKTCSKMPHNLAHWSSMDLYIWSNKKNKKGLTKAHDCMVPSPKERRRVHGEWEASAKKSAVRINCDTFLLQSWRSKGMHRSAQGVVAGLGQSQH